jgi:hypothetical protein
VYFRFAGARGKVRLETPKQYKERMMKERKQKKLAGDPDLLEPTIEDVSTLPDGYKVAVYPDGEVRVLKGTCGVYLGLGLGLALGGNG